LIDLGVRTHRQAPTALVNEQRLAKSEEGLGHFQIAVFVEYDGNQA
jgi:hypothetical protein